MRISPTPESLRALATWEPLFAAPGFSAGHWFESEPRDDGVFQMSYFIYAAAVESFVREAHDRGLVVDFDWPRWAGTAKARRYAENPGLVANAGAADLVRLLTTVVRNDRFCEGALAAAFESGLVLAITRRAGELAQGI